MAVAEINGLPADDNSFYYDYFWSTGDGTDTTNVLVSGNVYLTVTDWRGCDVVATAFIEVPEPLAVTHLAPDILCHGDQIQLDITASGGYAPYAGIGIYTTVPARTNTLLLIARVALSS